MACVLSPVAARLLRAAPLVAVGVQVVACCKILHAWLLHAGVLRPRHVPTLHHLNRVSWLALISIPTAACVP